MKTHRHCKRLSLPLVLRQSIFLFLIFFSFHLANARTVTIPVIGLMSTAGKSVPIQTEWDEKWFWENSSYTYNHKIARIAAFLSTISYVQVEKNPSSNELLDTYRVLGFNDSNIEWNYILDYTATLSGNNQAAYSFASKTIQTPEGSKNLVFVVLRGTPLSANEWISNINVSDTTHKNTEIHEGFLRTNKNIILALYDYLEKNKISPKESYFLITGHSRGAALANLLGAMLADEDKIDTDKTFIYTFAAPNVSQEERTADSKYNFIWNIVNAEDIVPSIPPNRNNWKWKKFGNTKIIVNYWNTDQNLYLNDYMPKMNSYFSQLILRDYSPFKNGPFIQIQVARILTSLYKTTESYYGNFFGLHGMAEKIFWKVFPQKSDLPEEITSEKEKMPALLRMVQKNVNANIDGGFEYAMNALVDMHACETYLSWMLALNENELFSDLGSIQLAIDGNYDCAVYDDEGNMLCRILDGAFELYSLKVPVAGLPLPRKNIIGFPGNENLTVVIHKNSLLPTIIGCQIEHYNAEGKLLYKSKKQHLYPSTGHVLRFEAGKVTFNQDSVDYEKLSRKESKPIINEYGLGQNIKFKIQPEFGISTEEIISLGFRTGNQEIYASFLGEFFFSNADAIAIATGVGHQHCLYGSIMMDIEGFGRFVWASITDKNRKMEFVPMGRISLSYKPRHRVQFFAAGVFDMHIDGFNDTVFDGKIRRETFPRIHLSEKLSLYPSLNFGIRL